MDGVTTVATYAYDGRNFRVSKTISGTVRHFYYSSGWQCLEERLNSSSYANRQYLWGLRYIDDLVLRDRDGDGNSGTGNYGKSGSGLEERLYCLQDANWNVVAISNPSGAMQERYSYDAYGRSTVLTGVFGSRGTSSYDWETRYTGRQLDEDTGFQDSRNRWYGSHLGRWLSRDPIGYRTSIGTGQEMPCLTSVNGQILAISRPPHTVITWSNGSRPVAANSPSPSRETTGLYVYVGNSPSNQVDPSGLQPPCFNDPPNRFHKPPKPEPYKSCPCSQAHPTWPKCKKNQSITGLAEWYVKETCGGRARVTYCEYLKDPVGPSRPEGIRRADNCPLPGCGYLYHCHVMVWRNGQWISGDVLDGVRYQISIQGCWCCDGDIESMDPMRQHWSSLSDKLPPPECTH